MIKIGIGNWIAAFEIAEHTKITLERCQKVITVPSVDVTKGVLQGMPFKTVLIRRRVSGKTVKGVSRITGTTPDLVARGTAITCMRKIGAKHATHHRLDFSTAHAIPLPV
jgi:hypothetical protein